MSRLFLLLSLFIVATAASAQSSGFDSGFDNEGPAIQDGIYKKTKRHVTIHVFFGQKPGCYEVMLLDFSSSKYRANVLTCGVTSENIPAKRAEVIALLSRSILETDELISRHVEATAQTSSADAADIAVLDGQGARLARAADGLLIDIWLQAPAIFVNKSKDGETKTQWLRTRFMYKSANRSNVEGAGVAKINATIWEGSIVGNRQGLVSAAGLYRVGTLKLTGGAVTKLNEPKKYFSNIEIELAGLGYASTYAVTKNVGIYLSAAIGIGMRVIDQNSAKLSYASPMDMRAGLLLADKLYLGSKAEIELGGETLRETYGFEMMYHTKKRDTWGVALEHVEHNGKDALVTDSNGWNLNFGYFRRF